MSSLKSVADQMREAGIRKVVFSERGGFFLPAFVLPDGGGTTGISEIELSDTIPAPPPFEGELDSEPDKAPGTCIALGCTEPGGWHFDRRYCGPHGRSAAGVKP